MRPDLVEALLAENQDKRFTVAFLHKTGGTLTEELKAGTDPNDWAKRETSEETYPKIAEMIRIFGEEIQANCQKSNLPVYETSGDFTNKIEALAEKLIG